MDGFFVDSIGRAWCINGKRTNYDPHVEVEIQEQDGGSIVWLVVEGGEVVEECDFHATKEDLLEALEGAPLVWGGNWQEAQQEVLDVWALLNMALAVLFADDGSHFPEGRLPTVRGMLQEAYNLVDGWIVSDAAGYVHSCIEKGEDHEEGSVHRQGDEGKGAVQDAD